MKTTLIQIINDEQGFMNEVKDTLTELPKAEVHFSVAISPTGQVLRSALFIVR